MKGGLVGQLLLRPIYRLTVTSLQFLAQIGTTACR